MAACLSCGAELSDGARFCAFCGANVSTTGPASEERRTVSILFVDLVGFTERSDRADPEDVRRTLVPFHRRVKDELQRYGGTLDKFIGDAVMGVFGAPVTHEDDPLRAVRAALAILRSLEDLRKIDPEIAIRVAVNTGEAIVSFGTGPQVGEAVAGDVVNTASRMQSLAPRDAVVIGETTLRAVRDRFDVEALPPAMVKGKSEALEVWRVAGERSVADASERAPFVGRPRELATLLSRFDQVVQSSSSHIVMVVADAGVGKSRLVDEFCSRVGERARRLTGACLPYGEGVTFAPVDQTLRALVDLEAIADPADAMARLGSRVVALEPDPAEQRWLLATLGAMLGVAIDGLPFDAEQIAQAWARMLAAVDGPVLLVIEDLHDAAPSFVDVLDATVSLLASRPVIVLVTSRPVEEPVVLARSSTLTLAPLAHDETRVLLGSVLLGVGVSDDERTTVLERAAGNPLFAIEFARMLMEGGGEAAPSSVQGVIAARLDAVPAEKRGFALDASVLGEEVWPDALAALSSRSFEDVTAGLSDLARRGLLEPRASSFPGHDAYGFSHALIREVAYGRLPRAARARRHLMAGQWLETASGDRVEEWAESLARHYASAAELAAASSEAAVLAEAAEPAVRWLLAAGDRAGRLDPVAAFATFERALALVPDGSRERWQTLMQLGHAGRRSGLLDAQEVLARYEQALAIARSLDDGVAIGHSLTRLGPQLAVTGDVEGARATLAQAVETLERLSPSQALARAYAYRAEEELFAGNTTEASSFADRALALLKDDLDEIAIMSLHIRGDCRCSMGDIESGIADLEDALRRSEEAGRVGDIVTSRNYLGEWKWATQGAAAGLAEFEAALELAERRNVQSHATYSKASALSALSEMGEWDRVLEWSADLLALPEGRLDPAIAVVAHVNRAHILIARGRLDEVIDPDQLVDMADRTQEVAAQAPALSVAASIALTRGDRGRVIELLERFESLTEDVAPEYRAVDLANVVRMAIAVDRVDLAERMMPSDEPKTERDALRLEVARAALADAHGQADAADGYRVIATRLREYGDAFEESVALASRLRLVDDHAGRERLHAISERLGLG
jgi:class 3 adenylate cyclase/tetratricopeptide (TPR) repeat protein